MTATPGQRPRPPGGPGPCESEVNREAVFSRLMRALEGLVPAGGRRRAPEDGWARGLRFSLFTVVKEVRRAAPGEDAEGGPARLGPAMGSCISNSRCNLVFPKTARRSGSGRADVASNLLRPHYFFKEF